MRVLEQEQHRPVLRQILQLSDERREDPLALLSRVVRQWRIAIAGRHRQQVGEYGLRFLIAVARLGQQRRQLVEFRRGGVIAGKARGALKLGNDRKERAVAAVRRAEIAQPDRPLGFEPLLQCRSNPGLADAGLTGNQHDLTFAVLGLGPPSQQQLDFLVAADERAQRRRTQCLETALDRALAEHLRGRYRLGQPLDRDSPEIAVVEEIANQPPRAFRDQHRVRWRHFL